MVARILIILIGIWLTASADILNLTGIMAATVAIVAISESVRDFRYLNTVSGVWLLAAPWLLGYHTSAAMWNDLIAGASLVGFSLIRGNVKECFGGRWRSLFTQTPEHVLAAKAADKA